MGDNEQASRWYEQSLALHRELENPWGIRRVLHYQGQVASEKRDYALAETLYQQSLALAQEANDLHRIAASLNALGELARTRGHYTQAATFYEQAWQTSLKQGYKGATFLHNLGHAVLRQGDASRASELFKQSLRLSQDSHRVDTTLGCLAGMAGAAAAGTPAEAKRAAQLLGAAEALLETTGIRLTGVDQDAYDDCAAAVRARLDDATFAALLEQGRAMTLEQAITYALADEHAASE